MNTFKKNGGFTLVELIIVIAILAILSTGAIAGYSAYIESANNAAVESVLGEIYTSAVLANAEAGKITSVEVKESATGLEIKVSAPTLAGDFDTYFEKSITVLATADVVPGTNNADDTYTVTIAKPSAWDNSKYDGMKTTCTAGTWSEPASIT